MVFNKIDAYSFVEKEEDDLTPTERENLSLDDLKKTWMADSGYRSVFISAKEKNQYRWIAEVLYEEVKRIHAKRYPYNSYLYEIPEDTADDS